MPSIMTLSCSICTGKICSTTRRAYCDGITSVTEPVLSRNHTELMLQGFGASANLRKTTASIVGNPKLYGQKIQIQETSLLQHILLPQLPLFQMQN